MERWYTEEGKEGGNSIDRLEMTWKDERYGDLWKKDQTEGLLASHSVFSWLTSDTEVFATQPDLVTTRGRIEAALEGESSSSPYPRNR